MTNELDQLSEIIARNSHWVTVSFDDWIIDDISLTKGNRVKCIVTPSESVRGLNSYISEYFWKQSHRRYPLEFWSEILAYQIAPFCHIDVPVTYPSWLKTSITRESYHPGSLTRFLLKRRDEESLLHGGDILSRLKPDFERKKGSDHSVQLCRRILTSEQYDLLFGQFVFDAIIGNRDRHQDNWALIHDSKAEAKNRFRVSATFDNGSSLGRELKDEAIEDLMRNTKMFEAYISRGQSHVRWEEAGKLEICSHEDLMIRHLSEFPELRPKFEMVISFSEAHVAKSISRVSSMSRDQDINPSIVISNVREDFLIKLILRRRERLSLL